MHHPTRLLPFLLLLFAVAPSRADGPPAGPGARGGPPRPEGPVEGSGVPARQRTLIGWYATLESAKAEAKRSGRPILLLSAAPHCHGISGVW